MSIQQGPGFRANETIPAFVCVATNASSTTQELRVEIADTSTSRGIGIIQDIAQPEGSADVITFGLARGLAATTTAAGALLTWQTATGQVMPISDAATITVFAIGTALAPGTNGSVIPILVNPQHITNS